MFKVALLALPRLPTERTLPEYEISPPTDRSDHGRQLVPDSCFAHPVPQPDNQTEVWHDKLPAKLRQPVHHGRSTRGDDDDARWPLPAITSPFASCNICSRVVRQIEHSTECIYPVSTVCVSEERRAGRHSCTLPK